MRVPIPRRAGLATLLLTGLVLGSCSTRDHDNPLDPSNPGTRGEPRWLEALADAGAVDLSWEVPGFDDLDSIRVVDVTAGTVLWRGAPGMGGLRQDSLENGVPRSYRLELEVRDREPRALPAVEAEPGVEVPWVLDDGRGRALRLTPDLRGDRARIPASQAASLRVDPDSATVLILDFFAGRVRLLDRDGEERWRAEGFERPLAALAAAGAWWVADPGAGTVTLLDATGAPVLSDSSFVLPVDLAPGPGGTVWVADNAGEIVLLSAAAGPLRRVPVEGVPDALAPAGEGDVWVSEVEGDRLLRVTAEGATALTLEGWPAVTGLTPDPVVEGGVWVSERATGAVRLLDREGVERRSIDAPRAPSMCVTDPSGSRIWIADTGGGAVLLVDREGNLLRRRDGLSAPITIQVAFPPPR